MRIFVRKIPLLVGCQSIPGLVFADLELYEFIYRLPRLLVRREHPQHSAIIGLTTVKGDVVAQFLQGR